MVIKMVAAWRAANIRELKSIIDYCHYKENAIPLPFSSLLELKSLECQVVKWWHEY